MYIKINDSIICNCDRLIYLCLSTEFWDIGDPIYTCQFCNALFWYDERVGKSKNPRVPRYVLCCRSGDIQLPTMKPPPQLLYDLIYGSDKKSKHFLDNIRSYNNMFSFTSMGGEIEWSINDGSSPPTFCLHGQNYHLIGDLLPTEGSTPKFGQLYIYDTENEVANRIMAIRYC